MCFIEVKINVKRFREREAEDYRKFLRERKKGEEDRESNKCSYNCKLSDSKLYKLNAL